MKTAISIPDTLFEQAEAYAHQHNLSRSELYAQALKQFLDEQRQAEITKHLDAIYLTQSSAIDPAWLRAQSEILPKEEW